MAETLVARRHGWPADGCCANCGTALAGDWCHQCGQRAHDHHRSLRHLGYEALEGVTHADSRLWRTLRLLALRPATLTLDYLRGRRAREIPPLRLFLITLVTVFALGAITDSVQVNHQLTGQSATEVHHAIDGITIHGHPAISAWLRVHVGRAVNDPVGLIEVMRDWAERFAFLLLPLSALALKLLFPFRRDALLYDHLVFTMHSLSFCGLVVAAMMLLGVLPVVGNYAGLLLLVLPVHLFAHLRGVYRLSVGGTLARMVLLGLITGVIFVMLLAGLAVLSLSVMRG